MKKETILKYISNSASKQEEKLVLDWARSSEDNELYIARLKNLWISQNMTNEKASIGEMQLMRESILSRKDKKFADSPKTYQFRKTHFWTAIAACIVLLLTTGLHFTGSIGGNKFHGVIGVAEQVYLSPKNIQSYKELYTPKGAKARLVLPDSSIVWLNSDTRIEYPDRFDSLIRSVSISGEAYFEVTKDSLRPMLVRTDKGFAVKVLGTKFNLKCYDNDEQARATLYSGSIDIIREVDSGIARTKKILTTKVLPNETFVINSENECSKVLLPIPKDQSAWKEGRIIFDATPLNEVIKILHRWHGVDFIVNDSKILDYKITAMFNSESIVQIMDLIQSTSFIGYKIEGSKVYLSIR